jgi:hypothetical protein
MQKFTTAAPIAAVLDIPAGRVRVVAVDRGEAIVEVLPADASKSRDVKAAEQTTVHYADGVLRITAAKSRSLGPSGSLAVTVELPAGSRVEAKVASAEFHTAGRLGDIVFAGALGEITVDEAASVHLTTDAGNVSIGRLTGSAEITTSKGDISIAEAVRGTVVLRTEAGEISVGTAPEVSATLDAGTSYGRIHNSLRNADGAQLEIHATTAYGDITARSH